MVEGVAGRGGRAGWPGVGEREGWKAVGEWVGCEGEGVRGARGEGVRLEQVIDKGVPIFLSPLPSSSS